MAENRFKKVEQEYQRLKDLLDRGEIEADRMKSELKKLMVQDEQGRYWMVGGRSGEWYLYDNGQWQRSEPPSQSIQAEPGKETQRPVEISGQTQPLSRERSQAVQEEKPRPAVKSRRAAETESLLLLAVSPVAAFFFLGGLGLLVGIACGAVFGIFPIWNEIIEYFPRMVQDTRGKLAGGLIFAFLGGLAGFLGAGAAAFLLALVYNVNAFLFGGLRGRVRR